MPEWIPQTKERSGAIGLGVRIPIQQMDRIVNKYRFTDDRSEKSSGMDRRIGAWTQGKGLPVMVA